MKTPEHYIEMATWPNDVDRDKLRRLIKFIQADALWEAAAIVHMMSRGTKSEDRAIAIDEARDLISDAAHALEPGASPSPPVSEEEAEKFMAEFDAGKHPLSPGDLAALEKGREQLMDDIKKILADDAHLRIAHLSTALRDVINLFNDADKSPDGKSPVCTGDRREMWESVLKRYGTP
jgi:hypothetical protein